MESDSGKLFIGGISWDTNEARLREYFNKFGNVVEATIMKDRLTGRARGFGFVVFADPAVAEKVVMEKHLIDGRMVEAKKVVPRDYNHILNRNSSNSPVPSQTKKIFVGGLASTVTYADFKRYFEQYGTIIDVVVMYDHNTQRPRGFGFITFDSEEAVDKVLHKTFHELNGKMVEVKIAVPKELSPGPSSRLPVGGINFGLNRLNSNSNGCNQGTYSIRMDDERNGFSSSNRGYGFGLNFENGMFPGYGGSSNFISGLGYGRAISSYYSPNLSKFGYPIGYGSFGSASQSLFGNVELNHGINPRGSNFFISSGNWNPSGFNSASLSSPLSAHGVNSEVFIGNSSNESGENRFGLIDRSYERNNGMSTAIGYEGNFTHSYDGGSSYGGGSIYGESSWLSALSDLDGSNSLGYGLGAAVLNAAFKGDLTGFMDVYTGSNRQMNRGVAV